MKTFALSMILCLVVVAAFADTPTADGVMAEAKAKASSEHKIIFLHFGASWCGWCHKLDGFLDRPDIKPVFEKYFVPVKLVVQENETHKNLENPGADKLLEKLGNPAGLPYLAFFDAQGSLIVDSMYSTPGKAGKQNTGFPSEPVEVDWFVQMMQKAAPEMTPADLKTIESALRAPAKSLKP